MNDTLIRGWEKVTFTVKNGTEPPFTINVCGRDRWALACLMAAGDSGCTPIEDPAPRWSGYVHKLRQLSVQIETIQERHEGPFPGNHVRYVLRSHIVPADGGEVAA